MHCDGIPDLPQPLLEQNPESQPLWREVVVTAQYRLTLNKLYLLGRDQPVYINCFDAERHLQEILHIKYQTRWSTATSSDNNARRELTH